MSLIEWCERGYVPDGLLRVGMQALNTKRLWDEGYWNEGSRTRRQRAFLDSLRHGPIALHTDDANAQHYEVPAEFFKTVLGARLKYSGCYYGNLQSPDSRNISLAKAEEAMLQLTCERAGIAPGLIRDGATILDLGCGWGSLSLWIAEHFPKCEIFAVSNSATQKAFVDARAKERGLKNLEVWTRNMADFQPDRQFDRIVSVEMFEHMHNYQTLLTRIGGWLKADGKLFVHYFCHKSLAYPFETHGEENWMGKYFFTGGLMPSYDLLRSFPDTLRVEQDWWVNGRHYQRTCNQWLANLDANRMRVGDIFHQAYGADEATLWVQRWRMFFMACAELFGMRNGNVWGIGHYLLGPASRSSSA